MNKNRDAWRVLLFALGFLLVCSAGLARAAEPTTLRFGWGYDPAAQAIIEGFRLYQDSQAMPIVILPEARSVEVPYIKDRQGRRYHLTAFDGAEESPPSAHVDIPAYWVGIPATLGGTLNVQLLDAEGNVLQEINAAVQGTINQ